MKRIIFTLLLTLISVATWARNGLFDYEGIRYVVTGIGSTRVNVNNNTNGMDATYTGDIVIPETVYDEDGNAYTVTGVGSFAFRRSKITSIRLPKTVASIGDYAFYQTFSLKEVTIEADSHLKDIWQYAFAGSHVEVIRGIPSCLEKISDNAFLDCSDLRQIHGIPTSCSIKPEAFKNCTSLESEDGTPIVYVGNALVRVANGATDVVVRDGTTEVYAAAFKDCATLTSVIFPESIEIFPSTLTLRDHPLLEHVKLPSCVKELPYAMFHSCTNLKSFDFTGLTAISDFSFTLTGIESVDVPASVKSIGEKAFHSCANLASVTLHEGLETIGYCSFYGCTSLTEITLPSTVTTTSNSFENCTALKSATLTGPTQIKSTFLGCTALERFEIADIASWCNQSYTLMGSFNPIYYTHRLWYKGEELKHLVIPEGVTKIASYAFSNCESLLSVTLPTTLESIDQSFDECTNLSVLKILSPTLTASKVNSQAFKNCRKLYEVYNLCPYELKPGYSTFGNAALKAKVVHTSLDEPSCIVTDGDYIFYNDGAKLLLIGCSSISTDLVMPDDCLGQPYEIASYAFDSETRWTSITLSKNNTTVPDHAFTKCSNVERLIIPEGVVTLMTECFFRFTSLKEVVVPSTVVCGNGQYPFRQAVGKITIKCPIPDYCGLMDQAQFSEVEIAEGITYIGVNAFYTNRYIKKLHLPSTLKEIASGAFNSVTGVVDFTLPASLGIVGWSSFNQCRGTLTLNSIPTGSQGLGGNFTALKLGPTVTNIPKDAFKDVTNYKDVYICSSTMPQMDSWSFRGTSATLHVPFGMRDSYLAHPQWKNFPDIVEDFGDLSGDGQLDAEDVAPLVEDLVTAASETASATDASANRAKRDLNGDGRISIADITRLIHMMLPKK